MIILKLYFLILIFYLFLFDYKNPPLSKDSNILKVNDIYYKFEDIIHLISTNNEDYDAVCALDFKKLFMIDGYQLI